MFEQMRDVSTGVVEPAEQTSLMCDGPTAPIPVQPERRGFELPGTIWGVMVACYAMFFVCITVATGGSGHALFAIVVSVLYTAMFFATARLIARQGDDQGLSPLDRGEPLSTWCGPMTAAAVYGQVLIVPAAISFFGIAVAVICAIVL